jgi:hypothetical protein
VLEEIAEAPKELVLYLAQAARELLADLLPGYFLGDEISQQRVPVVISRLRQLGGC